MPDEPRLSRSQLDALCDRFQGVILQADRAALLEARMRGIGLLRLFATHDATREAFAAAKQELLEEAPQRRLLVVVEESDAPMDWAHRSLDPPVVQKPPPLRLLQTERVPGHAPPLERLGHSRIPATPGTGELPARGLTSAQLARLWGWLLDMRARRVDRHAAPFPDNAVAERFESWRARQREQAELYEAGLGLLHELMAPDFTYLCGVGCRHVESGLSAKLLDVFQESIEVWALGPITPMRSSTSSRPVGPR